MTISHPKLLRATCMALSLTGAVAVAATVVVPDFAYAKNSKSNSASSKSQSSNSQGSSKSSSSGGSKSNGSASGSSKSSKPSGGQSAKSVRKSKTVKLKVVNTKKITHAKKSVSGAHPSELGALNAAHANENALLNASPNSRVGRIAIFKEVVLAGQQLEIDLADASEDLAELTPPTDSSEVIDGQRMDAADQLALAETDLADIDAAIKEESDKAEPDPDVIAGLEEDRTAVSETIDGLNSEIATLDQEYDDAVAYETVETEVADLQDKVDAQPELETATLEEAANKPVTPEVETAVKEMLGLE